MKLKNWLIEHNLTGSFINKQVYEISGIGAFSIVDPKDGKIFNENFQLLVDDSEKYLGEDYYLFQFGEKWYYTEDPNNPELNEFKYLGRADLVLNEVDFPYLGVHGRYEIMNGTRHYKDWCKKANFLNIQTLGICEKQTLAGTFQFQKACQEYNIKPILGQRAFVKSEKDEYYIKLYVVNEKGWNNLLWINKAQLVDNVNEGKYVSEEELLKRGEGLICVIEPEINLKKWWIEKFKKSFDKTYFQFDVTEFKSDDKDKKRLLSLSHYLNNHFNILPPVFIKDSYYLDRGDAIIKKKLNSISQKFENQSFDQHFATVDEILGEITNFFQEDDERQEKLIDQGLEGLKEIEETCNFTIKTGELHLPVYQMNEEETKQFDSNEDLFWDLIEKGFQQKISGKVEDEQVYVDRVEEEFDIIKRGNLISYFLIWYDALRFAQENNIPYGLGRGSGSASLCSFLLGITNIDPIHWGLFFQRFLNESRIKSELADLDVDIASEHQETIKQYFIEKYGVDQTCYVGTCGVLKLKSLIKDLAKEDGISFGKVNYVTGTLPKKQQDELKNITELFQYASETPALKDFVQDNYETFNLLNSGLNSIRNKSIHASAVIIAPQYDSNNNRMTIYDWFPIRSEEGMLVSEFEGEELDELGFLKQDVLGLKQVDKIDEILKLIEKNKGEVLERDSIPLNDKKTFKLFQQGFNQDVFQFSSSGMMGFLKDLIPENIDHLIAANALYRPGTMASNFHKKYVKIKNGYEEPNYIWGTEELLKDTFGLLIFQEDTIRLIKNLGNFSLEDSEQVRAAIGKKKEKLMQKYKPQFIEGIKQNGGTEEIAKEIWEMIEVTSGYQFNKGHSTCYTITGYYTQYLKAHYPLEFWTVALQNDSDGKNFPYFVNEIDRMGDVEVKAPDINKSDFEYSYDVNTNEIFMSLSAIKNVGEVAVQNIIDERNENGKFYSIEEFLERINKSKVNKRVIENLIIAGTFDQVEQIERPQFRYDLLKKYYDLAKIKEGKEFDWNYIDQEHYWILQQRELTGLGQLNLEAIYNQSGLTKEYLPVEEFFDEKNVDKEFGISGLLTNFVERNTKRGTMVQLEVDCNMYKIYCTIWNDAYEPHKKLIKDSENKIISLTGMVKYDSWKKQNVLMSNEGTKIVKL